MDMKKFTGSLLIVLFAVNSSFAICYNKYLSAADSSNLGCYDSPPVYTPPSGCSISSSQMVGCLAHYQICCTGETTRYEDGAAQTMIGSNVNVGQEYEVANQLYQEALAGVGGSFSPACQSGFRSTSEARGFVYDVKPDPANLTKSEVRVSMFDRVGCESFSNNTTIILEPIGGTGGGTGGIVNIDMTATNTILNDIKTRLSELPGTDNNPVLLEIKTILQNGLAVTGGGSTDMTATNDLLTAIRTKLNGSCTSLWDPNLNCSWGDWDRDPATPDTPNCLGGDVITCNGIQVTDPTTVAALNDIKNILASGGGGGGTVNVDMTETNGFLSTISGLFADIKGFFNGASSLPENVDNTASKPAYSSSFFEIGTPTLDSYKGAFNGFTNDMKATPLYGLVGGFFRGAPTGGSSVVSFNGGVYGTHSYDFSSWVSIMSVIKGIVLVMFAAASIRIIFLKGGSG